MDPIVYPKDTGVLFRKEAGFVFQMHYTTNGKATTDRSRVAFSFTEVDNPPKYPLRLTALTDFKFTMPPGAKEHTTTVTREISRDVLVYDIMPHSQLRGRAGKMTAIYPDGSQEILPNVPKYDFNWQTVYSFREPKQIPAGSKLVWDFTWDNSAQNPANPDPMTPVKYGNRTFEEMGIGFVRFRFLDEEVSRPGTTHGPNKDAPVEKTASTLGAGNRTAGARCRHRSIRGGSQEQPLFFSAALIDPVAVWRIASMTAMHWL